MQVRTSGLRDFPSTFRTRIAVLQSHSLTLSSLSAVTRVFTKPSSSKINGGVLKILKRKQSKNPRCVQYLRRQAASRRIEMNLSSDPSDTVTHLLNPAGPQMRNNRRYSGCNFFRSWNTVLGHASMQQWDAHELIHGDVPIGRFGITNFLYPRTDDR